jgi:hypothetical protein
MVYLHGGSLKRGKCSQVEHYFSMEERVLHFLKTKLQAQFCGYYFVVVVSYLEELTKMTSPWNRFEQALAKKSRKFENLQRTHWRRGHQNFNQNQWDTRY